MMDDPYQILGVAKDAPQDAIRKAYRKLAKELHPDLNPGNKDAEQRFKDVSAAYSLLSDEEKRARFDRGEIDASGAERPEQHYYRQYAEADPSGRYRSSAGMGDFEDMSDLFADLFGSRGGRGGPRGTMQAKGRDLRYQLHIEFLDAVNGATRRITLPDESALNLTIPAGTRDGAVLRLKGKGYPGFNGGPAGDALIEIAVKPHPLFALDGDDIVVAVPITIDEAVLGGKIEVPTITGRVAMTVPKGANTGDTLRLKGKGVKTKTGAGDQRVVLEVVMPPKIDAGLEAFMEKWREENSYDPRANLRSAS